MSMSVGGVGGRNAAMHVCLFFLFVCLQKSQSVVSCFRLTRVNWS